MGSTSELETQKYDVALLDVHMPGMSGTEASKLYQFSLPENPTPIVILTADATSSARLEAEEAGAVAFLPKPLRANELRAAVSRYSRKRVPPTTLKLNEKSFAGNTPYNLPNKLIDSRELEELKSLGVSKDLLREMIFEFEEDSKRIIESSLGAIMRKDIASVKDYMHTLRGSSATVGADLLRFRAQQLEEASYEELEKNFKIRYQNMMMILERTINALLTEIDRETAG